MRRLSKLFRRLGLTVTAASVLAGAVVRADTPAANAKATADRLGVALRSNQVRGDEITPAAEDAIKRGLTWLAGHQAPNGAFGGGVSGAGISALCGLAFMADGNLPGRGKYGANVQRALEFVLKNTSEEGLISSDAIHGVMYGHGFATLFLGEIYGMTGDDAVREKLSKAVALIQRTQNKEGGWRYAPQPSDADISVTICQVMALRAGRDAGLKIDVSTIKQAISYVKGCQLPDGGFSYQKGSGGAGFARSSAGIAALYYAGDFEGDSLKKGLDYLMTFVPAKTGGAAADMEYFYYGNYYAAQAMFLAGGDYWAKWYPFVRDLFINRQKATPTRDHWTGDIHDDYSTATALIVLQMPNRYLPVFNGKGPGG